MGWLRDLMQAASPRVGSYDALARVCLDSERWPDSSRMPVRSLGAIFGKLDRGENLGWLAGRPAVLAELARVLDAPRETLRLALRPDVHAEPARWLTLDSLPYGRGLDLLEEELFPGIPSEVLHPGRWQRMVWVAPAGAGRTLTGRWLEARGLCRRYGASRFDESDLPRTRPLFVELASGTGFDPARVPLGVCVAVPEPWSKTGATGVEVVRSPPIAALLRPLLDWCHARLSSRSALDPERLARLIERRYLDNGVVESAGDVLGLAGLADEHGSEAVEARPLRRLASEFLKRRANERLDPENPATASLRRGGFDALMALARCFLLDPAEAPFAARTLEEWSRLLPVELRHGPDLEWLRVALPGAESGVTAAELERAAKKLPPGAFRLLRAFEELGVLEREDDERLLLRPHWLVRAALGEALEELVSGSPLDWGEALLNPRASAAVAARLLDRARSGTLPLDELLEPVADDSPAHAAAVEAAFRIAGVGALFGVEPSHDLLRALWEEQLSLVFEAPGALPEPRIDHATRDAPGAWPLDRGVFYLSALALGELLDAPPERRHAVLRPWQETAPPAGLDRLLDEVAAALARPNAPPELRGPAVGLVARLRAVLGRLGPLGAPHPLERPAEIADELSLGVLRWSSIAALAADPVLSAGLAELLAARGLAAGFSEAVWQAHREAGAPRDGVAALFARELLPLVWAGAPDQALELLLEHPEGLPVAAELPPERLKTLFAGDLAHAPLELFTLAPAGALAGVVASAARAGRDDALTLFWARHAAELSALVGRSLAAGALDASALDSDTLARLVRAAPEEATLALVRGLGDAKSLLRAPAERLLLVRMLLHRRLSRRSPGFREAYALFHELEGHVKSVTRQH